jgi:asparagine N-glycosylation enzyme membrane subunit Stt3
MNAQPPVIRWMGIYAWGMVGLYIVVVAVSLLAGDLLREEPEFQDFPLRIYLFLCLALAVPFGLWAFLPSRPWVWVYGIVLIAIGLGSCLTLPVCVFLLIRWIEPRVREWYEGPAA